MRDIDLGLCAMLVTLVAAIIGPLDSDTGQPIDLFDLPGQGMADIGIARRRWGAAALIYLSDHSIS